MDKLNNVEDLKVVLDCLDTCRHLGEGLFLTTIDAPILSLAKAYGRKVERAELVGDFLVP